EINLGNAADSGATHSIDLHAVTGPGGGATVTQVMPGGTGSFTFKALNPGVVRLPLRHADCSWSVRPWSCSAPVRTPAHLAYERPSTLSASPLRLLGPRGCNQAFDHCHQHAHVEWLDQHRSNAELLCGLG